MTWRIYGFITIVPIVLGCQGRGENQAAQAGSAQPQFRGQGLSLQPGSINFGVRPVWSEEKFSATLVNGGTEPVEIGDIQADCACANLKVEKKALQPGETAKLTGILRLGGNAAEFQRQVRVIVDKPQQQILVLTLSGKAQRTIRVTPETLTLRPSFLDAKSSEAKLTVENGWEEAITLNSVTRLTDGVVARVSKDTILPGEACEVTFTAEPVFLMPLKLQPLLVTSHPREAQIVVSVSIVPADGFLSIIPDAIRLGVVGKEELLRTAAH